MDKAAAVAPAVTVIIVVLNGEAYIEEAIDSVVRQTLADWELIVVDDGSTDETAAIVQGYEEELSGKLRLFRHADKGNHGISASRNLGLTHASGNFICFLDADDVWMPKKLAEQVAIMSADPSLGMIYGRSLIWHSWDKYSAISDFCYPLGVEPDKRYDPPVLLELLLENRAQTPTSCNALMRASLFKALGGFDESFPLMFEDQTFFAKALAFAPAYVSSQTWAKYRQHSKSCTAVSAAAGADQKARLSFLLWLNGSMGQFNPSMRVRSAIWRALAQASWTTGKRETRACLRALLR